MRHTALTETPRRSNPALEVADKILCARVELRSLHLGANGGGQPHVTICEDRASRVVREHHHLRFLLRLVEEERVAVDVLRDNHLLSLSLTAMTRMTTP